MDVGDKEKLEGEKKNEDSVNYHTHQLPSVAMANSYGAVVWDHHGNLQPCSSWEEPNSVTKEGFFVSANIPNISQAPADSAFIERAARFSCFNSGNVTDLINSFPMNQPDTSYHQLSSIPHGPQKIETNPPSTSKDEAKQIESDEAECDGACGQDKNSLMDNTNESSLPKGVGHKKRRRAGCQDTEPEINGNHIQSSPTTKINGKNASDPQKEEYIHVRARRGQATNSHSLAERIRREKISKRMKYLQDLVPGCSKVTGKAVMLDEIINYVQSLQRQVEFLSMKLATVDHKVDFNIDSLLAKEQLFPTLVGPSSSMGLSQDLPMAYPPSMHPCQTPQLTSMIPNVWDYDLQFQNVVQMGFDHSNPVQNQGPNSPLSPNETKPEP